MPYSIEPKYQIFVKGYEFCPFAKNIGKNLSGKYSQKLLIMLNKQLQKDQSRK